VALCLVVAWATPSAASAQVPLVTTPRPLLEAIAAAEPSGEPATVSYFNRPFATLRARVLGREPADRAANAVRTLDELVAQGVMQPVEMRLVDSAALITVGGRGVLVLTPADLDAVSGETVQQAASEVVNRLQRALAEVGEARTPARLIRSTAVALGALTVGFLLLAAVGRSRRAASARLEALSEKTVAKSGIADVQLLRASRLLDFERRLVLMAAAALQIVIAYSTLTFVLRRFPFTRPWGETMRGFLIATVQNLALGIAHAIPGLFTVVIILLIARFVARLIGVWFNAVEHGRLAPPRWLHPETAPPTRRLVTALVWLFALVVVYPYVPGSQTDAFKGVSVLVGLMITLGSSGLVTQIMGSFVITYSRALRVGDFVRIGDVEGTVTQLGLLSTKIKTLKQEEVTIPNALVIAQTTTDYSRLADTEGVFTPTTVTIGYDAPWRQVHELLLRAAERTPGLRAEPTPVVLQGALQDFYVQYTLFVCLERQQSRPFTMGALHANIQDLFNEYGVQIMSPHYYFDPASPKIVPKHQWFAAPASPDQKRPSVVAGAHAGD
jgi:small-conductance mechanosensitive channel